MPLRKRDEVEDRADVAVEGVVALAGEDRDAVLLDDRLRRRGSGSSGSSAGRCCSAASSRGRTASCSATSTSSGRCCRGTPARPCGRSGTRRRCPAARRRSVDVDLVLRVRRERVVVRAGRRILTRDPVGDDRHGVRLVRAPERVQVRVVGARILRDQRRLTVARGGAGARAGADDRSGERRDRDCSESGGRQCCLLHFPHSCRWSVDGPCSAASGDRFDRRFRGEPIAARGRTGGVLAVALNRAHAQPRPRPPLRRGARRARRAVGRIGARGALRPGRRHRLRPRLPRPPRRGARRGRRAGGLPRALAQRGLVHPGAREGVDLDPDARPPARRRPRPARAAAPRRAARGRPGAGGRLGRGGGVAPARPGARAGRARAAARPAARGDRARLLRRLHPVGARRAARAAARHDQEQNVLGLARLRELLDEGTERTGWTYTS